MNLIDKAITLASYLRQPEKRRLIKIAKTFKGLKGIEIGGPSNIFSIRGAMPVYLFAEKLDGVNFSNKTIWEGKIKEGENYNYYKNLFGFQYIAEGSDLSLLKDNQFDFLLSSHSLEHIANPIKALNHWRRILKQRGRLVLILPDSSVTFDRKRPITKLEHMIEDYNNDVQEDDETHFKEVIDLHDMDLDKALGSRDILKERTIQNLSYRAVHHHVFNFELIKELLSYTGFTVDLQQNFYPFHLITLETKK
jgi:SAM-dependent methyltransferase